jgi:hypothetical protein
VKPVGVELNRWQCGIESIHLKCICYRKKSDQLGLNNSEPTKRVYPTLLSICLLTSTTFRDQGTLYDLRRIQQEVLENPPINS